MEREIDILEISDGKKYTANDLVKVGCSDCKGCSDCCRDMAGLITLDPYDIARLISGTGKSFDTLLGEKNIELIVDRALLLPALAMDEDTNACTFLTDEGRCSIHGFRPGICRLYPMGRVYEDDSFYYFLQIGECTYPGKTKVKLKKWLDTPDLARYEKYITDWHYATRRFQEYLLRNDEAEVRQVNTLLLTIFFRNPYGDDFYTDFYNRLEKVNALF